MCHQRVNLLITSLPFVHTARRSYRLNDPVRPPDCGSVAGSPALVPREAVRTLSFRGRRSRNKVSVGEPAEGSLPVFPTPTFDASCVLHSFGPVSLRSVQMLGLPSPGPHLASPLQFTAPPSWSRSSRSWTTTPYKITQLLPMDILALATMKNAAKCDT